MLADIQEKSKGVGVALTDSDLNKIKESLHKRTYIKAKEGHLDLMEIRQWAFGQIEEEYTVYHAIKFAFVDGQPSHISDLLHSIDSGSTTSFIPLNAVANLDMRLGIELTLKKLKDVAKRQQERLKSLEKGEAVAIPQYFHATEENAAISIAKTGIEPVVASTGFGAFVSAEPEFRYGYVTLGLPKTIEFSSKAHTILHKNSVPPFNVENKVWAGLKELISVNPRVIALKRNFLLAIRQAVSMCPKEMVGLSDQRRIELEERLVKAFDRSVVFRPETSKEGKQEGWSLNYRKLTGLELPGGNVIKINKDEDFNQWTDLLMDIAMKNAEIAVEQHAQLRQSLLTKFEENFKQAYYYGQEPQTNYVVKGKVTEKIKACVIAPDDEFKEIYEKEYKIKVKGAPKQLKTISEVETQFIEAGLGKDLVEFIPLSEQLIERDYLMQLDAKEPQAWMQ